jgi:hypothetical protein
MNKQALHNLIDKIPDNQVEMVYKVILPYIEEVNPLPDEITAIQTAEKEILNNDLVSHNQIDWN